MFICTDGVNMIHPSQESLGEEVEEKKLKMQTSPTAARVQPPLYCEQPVGWSYHPTCLQDWYPVLGLAHSSYLLSASLSPL